MHRVHSSLLAGCALIASAGSANARPYYFSKPNVEPTVYNNDLAECRELASGVHVATPGVYPPTPAASAAAGFLGGIARSRERRALTENILQTCMTNKGYRRMEATPEEAAVLGHLSPEERNKRLAELAAGAELPGETPPQ